MSLPQEIRPDTLEDVVGNSATVGGLKSLLRKPSTSRNHSIIFKGPSGCGKTTLARILAKEFGSNADSIIELNAANTNGIGTAREVSETAHLMGFGGKVKTYIFDECFLGKSRVLVDYDKSLSIKDIVEDESIQEVLSYDIEQKRIVKKKIVRKIKKSLLSSMCKTFVSDGEKTYQIDSTRTHKFYVLGKGYVTAEKLEPGDKLIRYDGEYNNLYKCSKCDAILNTKEEYRKHHYFHSPSGGSSRHKSGNCKYCGKFFRYLQVHEYWAHEASEDKKKAKRIRQSVSKREFLESDAGKEYCQNISDRQKGEKNTLYLHGGRGLKKLVAYNKRRWANLSDSEKEEQIKRFINAPKYKNVPNNPEKLVISMNISNLEYVGDGSFFLTLKVDKKNKKKNPDFVVRKRNVEGKIVSAKKFVEVMDLEYWHKDDWKGIQDAYLKAGFEILILDAKRVVENSAMVKAELEAFVNNCYAEVVEPPLSKSGRRKNSYVNFRSKGVEFVYNLEVEDTHNYFILAAPDDSNLRNKYEDSKCLPILVSNCHELTGKAQEALLKILEDGPDHCYFIFCTTSPEKLITTIHNRSAEFTVEKLCRDEIEAVLRRACEKKSWDISTDIIEAITLTCEGSPRAALVSLELVSEIKDVDIALELLVNGTEKDKQIFDLLKLLVMYPEQRRKKCQRILRTYNAIDLNSEVIRQSISTFLFNKMLKSNSEEDIKDMTHLILIFSENTFYGKKSKLGALIVRACFETWKD